MRRAFGTKAFGTLLCVLCVAFFAAPLAHYAVDLACDYLVSHDPFDDIGHASRELSLALSGLAGIGTLGIALARAIARARGRDGVFCRELTASIGVSPLRFALAVAALVVPLVAAMEAFDLRVAGGAADDLGDLFGGSLAVGASVSALAAFGTGVLAWFALRRIARAIVPSLALAIVVLLRFARATTGGDVRASRVRRARPIALALWFRRRLSGRAPPSFSSPIPA
jgi:hypothetical protein